MLPRIRGMRALFCGVVGETDRPGRSVFEDHPDVGGWRAEAFEMMVACPDVDFQLLTKRPENILRFVPPTWVTGWPVNVWMGTTVEDQVRADERLPHLLDIPASVRFLSCEPLLGMIDLRLGERESCPEWIIIGGESGAGARPMHPEWAYYLRIQARKHEVAAWFKQWGEWAPAEGLTLATHHLSIGGVLHPVGEGRYVEIGDARIARVGRAKAGHLLAGEEIHEWPATREVVS